MFKSLVLHENEYFSTVQDMFTFSHLAFRYAQCMFTSWFLPENEFFTTEQDMFTFSHLAFRSAQRYVQILVFT